MLTSAISANTWL